MKQILLHAISIVFISLFFPRVTTGQEITVMTLNLRYDEPKDLENSWPFRKADVLQSVLKHAPVFFGIQEGLHHQVAYLDSALTQHTYIGGGRDDGKEAGEYSALFYDSTQFRCLEHEMFWLSESPDKPSKGWDSEYYRVCTYGLFEHKITHRRIWVYNTHFDHVATEARRNSAKMIVARINENSQGRDIPIILMGDFNATPDDEPIQIIRNDLADAKALSSTAFTGPAGTFNGFEIKAPLDRRIDYIFVKHLTVLSYTHLEDKTHEGRWISDHLPVVAVLRM